MAAPKVKVLLDSGVEEYMSLEDFFANRIRTTVEADNLQTHGDITLGTGTGDGASVIMYNGVNNYSSTISPSSSNTDNTQNIAPASAGILVNSNVFQSENDPTTADVADGTFKIWYNTTTGFAGVYMNIGGTLAVVPFCFPSEEDEAPAITYIVGGRPRHLA